MTIYAVKNYNNTQTGAPVVSGTVGAGIAWLDAMLINGFNSKTVTTLTRTDTTATLDLVAHGFVVGDCIEISGVTNDTNWNGEYIILTATADQMTFTVPITLNAAPTGTTITIKYPPISPYWAKVFTGTNQAIYHSTHPQSTGWFLRVDDATDARYMTVSIIEGWTTFTTGLLNRYDVFWMKSDTASSSARPWVFVGDSMCFFPMTSWSTYGSYNWTGRRMMEGNFFGDILTTKPSDGYHCAIQGNYNATYVLANSYIIGHYDYNSFCCTDESRSSGSLILRHWNQVGTQVGFVKASMYSTATIGYTGYTYPNPSDGGLYFDNVWVYQGGGVRGKFPGMYVPINAVRENLQTGDKTVVKDGRTYMYVRLFCRMGPVHELFWRMLL